MEEGDKEEAEKGIKDFEKAGDDILGKLGLKKKKDGPKGSVKIGKGKLKKQ